MYVEFAEQNYERLASHISLSCQSCKIPKLFQRFVLFFANDQNISVIFICYFHIMFIKGSYDDNIICLEPIVKQNDIIPSITLEHVIRPIA